VKTVRRLLVCLLPLILAISCNPNKEEETATSGHLRLLIAESVAPVILAGVNGFTEQYRSRGADVTYTLEQSREAIHHFVYDTARAIVTTIPLTVREKELVQQTTDHLAEVVLGYDGVVAVVAAGNPAKQLTMRSIQGLLRGSVTDWRELGGPRLNKNRVRLVLQDSSDVTYYLSHRLLDTASIRASFIRASSPQQTLNIVAKDPGALGFVGLDWLDSAKGEIKVLDMMPDSSIVDTAFKAPQDAFGSAFSPNPAYLYLNYYPLKRAVYVYGRTSPGDFATGLISYLASPVVQKIFLSQGLVPGTQKIVLRRPDEQPQ
jgi:ABC-type phosphate transport system substrate-binding protein